MGNLDGKVALITGAGGMKGIGRATALKLASQGAELVFSDVKRAPENLPAQEGRGVLAQPDMHLRGEDWRPTRESGSLHL